MSNSQEQPSAGRKILPLKKSAAAAMPAHKKAAIEIGQPTSFGGYESPVPSLEMVTELRRSLAISQAEALVAKAAAARADKLAAISKKCFLALKEDKVDMADYEASVVLQEQHDKLREDNKELRAELSKLKRDAQLREADTASKNEQLASLQKNYGNLQNTFGELKRDLEDAKKSNDNIDAHLGTAYDDLAKERRDRESTAKALADAQGELKESEHKLKNARGEIAQQVVTIETLEESLANLDELEQSLQALEDEKEEYVKDSANVEQTIAIKDARIAHLEIQVQKAMESTQSAQAAAAAASSATPAEEHTPYTHGVSALKDELDNLSDRLSDTDYVSEYQQLELSDISIVADMAPTDAPKLMLGPVHATSSTPVPAPHTKTSAVQTDSTSLQRSNLQTTDVSPLRPEALSIQCSIAIPIESSISTTPVVPTSTKTKEQSSDSTTPTTTSDPTANMVDAKAPHHSGNPSSNTTKRYSSLLYYIVLTLLLWHVLDTFTNPSPHNKQGWRGPYAGAAGNGNYLFGLFPVGPAIARFEERMGLVPTPLY